MNRNCIVSGYKDIRSIDLTYVDPKYHKNIIDQHRAIISEYKRHQGDLKPEIQYDITNRDVLKTLEKDRQITKKIKKYTLLKNRQEDITSIRSRL